MEKSVISCWAMGIWWRLHWKIGDLTKQPLTYWVA